MDAEQGGDHRPLIRTFLAVDLDGAFLDEAAALAERLRGAPRLSDRGARWAVRDTLHVTLRFFGPTSDAHVEVLRGLVSSLAGAPPLLLRSASLTGFPDAAEARIVVVELEPSAPLTALAERAEAFAVGLGFAPEPRAYRPHVTLARLKRPANLRAHATDAAVLPAARATAITLYSSTSSVAGPVYTPLVRGPLPAS